MENRKNVEKIAETSLLYDFYGELLTEKQREVMGLYHEENYSLAEIAEEFDISRQAVHNTLKKAEKILQNYEEKLGLVSELFKQKEAIRRIDSAIDKVEDKVDDSSIRKELESIKDIIRELEI